MTFLSTTIMLGEAELPEPIKPRKAFRCSGTAVAEVAELNTAALPW